MQKLGLHITSLMETVKDKKLKYFGHTILEKDIIKGIIPRSTGRGRSKITSAMLRNGLD